MVEVGGEVGEGGEGRLHGLRPLEHTTSQTREVFEENTPGFEMAEVNCGAPPGTESSQTSERRIPAECFSAPRCKRHRVT